MEQYGSSAHLYADNTQIYGSFPLSNVSSLFPQINGCVLAVSDWVHGMITAYN